MLWLEGGPGQKHARCCVNDLFVTFKLLVYFNLNVNLQRMVYLMGAKFSKPLVAISVTHLVCYKFEGNNIINIS